MFSVTRAGFEHTVTIVRSWHIRIAFTFRHSRSRSATCLVELSGNARTIGLAGLLRKPRPSLGYQVPGLGSIPVTRFPVRRQSYQKGETELVIWVTPRWRGRYRRERSGLPRCLWWNPRMLISSLFAVSGGSTTDPQKSVCGCLPIMPQLTPALMVANDE